jgi:hypothetical protein
MPSSGYARYARHLISQMVIVCSSHLKSHVTYDNKKKKTRGAYEGSSLGFEQLSCPTCTAACSNSLIIVAYIVADAGVALHLHARRKKDIACVSA